MNDSYYNFIIHKLRAILIAFSLDNKLTDNIFKEIIEIKKLKIMHIYLIIFINI